MNAKPAKPTTESLRKQIEARAYAIWEEGGRPHGRHQEHWSRAEKEILSQSNAPARKKTKAAPAPKKPPALPTKPPKKRGKTKKT